MSPLETHNAVSLDFDISGFLVLGRSVSLHSPGQISFIFHPYLNPFWHFNSVLFYLYYCEQLRAEYAVDSGTVFLDVS